MTVADGYYRYERTVPFSGRADMKSWTTAIFNGLPACMLVSAAQAEVFVYPKPGQSQDAFGRDQYECHNWAQQQTASTLPRHPRRLPRRRRSRAAP